jgi:glycosyltransferase involved in cell wall biosynthesis
MSNRPHTRNKSLAIVVRGFDLRGAVANSSLHHAEALAKDYNVTIITDTGPAVYRQLGQSLGIRRIDTVSLGWLKRYAHVPVEFCFIVAAGFQLLFCREMSPFDAIVFHSHPPTALLAPILKCNSGCKVIMVVHGDIFDRPAGTYDPRLTLWYKVTTRRAYRVADAVIALSPYSRNLAIAGGANRDRVFVVPNGVDPAEIGLDQVDRDCAPQNPGDSKLKTILFIGRIEFNKGVDLIVQALARLKTSIPDVFLICIGAPNPLFMRSLRYQMIALGVEDSVDFISSLPRNQLGGYFRAATLVVVPSRSETQSTVLMESMAAGKPVIASDTGGNMMMVEDNETGLLFPTGDADALFLALKQLLLDPDRLQIMGDAARHRYANLYSLEKTGSDLRGVFAQITGSSLHPRTE